MAQRSWIYRKSIDDLPYHVSIYHGDNSRHVVIYSQSNIITIDFKVFGDKTYSFMLGDELFELCINWSKNEPDYLLMHVPSKTEVKEPGLNNFPKKDIVKALLFVAALANVVFLIFLSFKK